MEVVTPSHQLAYDHQSPTTHNNSINKSENVVSKKTTDNSPLLSFGLLKSESVLEFISHHNLDMLVVTEAWLTGSHDYDKMVIKACLNSMLLAGHVHARKAAAYCFYVMS
jgi:hypothetical protein